ncbi:hypothetical protein M9H77_17442 [Catharanthus roseus]|uniref:Uncharacterized protein n=1 Tax=Catharanthus roseus TaxID=4058 RepID=A0ACC0B4L4_CATRO|nr:hypothetical protein M9H77_17442 [Catharanthus roseus]
MYMTISLLNSSLVSTSLRMISGIADIYGGRDPYRVAISLMRPMYLSEESSDIPNFRICVGPHGMPSVRFICSSSMLRSPISSLMLYEKVDRIDLNFSIGALSVFYFFDGGEGLLGLTATFFFFTSIGKTLDKVRII